MFTNPENPLILVILILTFPAGTDFAQALIASMKFALSAFLI